MKTSRLVIAAIGNTTCRIALLQGDPVADAEPFAHEQVFTHEQWRDGGQLQAWLAVHAREARVGICSVVPALTDTLVEQCAPIAACEVIRPADGRAMQVEYETPQTLGADRYCAALGARALCGSPVIAVDFGTAITVNVVDARGVFIGGAIVPGYAASLRAMHETTALLPLSTGKDAVRTGETEPCIGRSTRAAMQIGVAEVLSRGIDAYVRACARELCGMGAADIKNTASDTPLSAETVSLCCTGGGAGQFFRIAGTGWRRISDLVQRGAACEMRLREALEGL